MPHIATPINVPLLTPSGCNGRWHCNSSHLMHNIDINDIACTLLPNAKRFCGTMPHTIPAFDAKHPWQHSTHPSRCEGAGSATLHFQLMCNIHHTPSHMGEEVVRQYFTSHCLQCPWWCHKNILEIKGVGSAMLCTVSVTTFEPKQCKQQVCKAQAQKGVDQALELKCENKEKIC